MRKIAANIVYVSSNKFLNKAIVTLDDNGIITEITDTKGRLDEQPNLEFYNGILTPAFVYAQQQYSYSRVLNYFGNESLANYVFDILTNHRAINNSFMQNYFINYKTGENDLPLISVNSIEMLATIAINFPSIPLPELLKLITSNGAKILGVDKVVGSIDVGKKPGLNLLENVDLLSLKLTANTKVKRLI
jgi:N-acetylglucosamine-6-phosphate deacetylase